MKKLSKNGVLTNKPWLNIYMGPMKDLQIHTISRQQILKLKEIFDYLAIQRNLEKVRPDN